MALLLGALSMTAAGSALAQERSGSEVTPLPETGITTEPRIVVLENGLTVLVLEDERFPLASVRLYVRAGSAYEDPAKAGISHVLEHMVFKGTEKRKPGEIAATVEGVGGYLNAATSFDYTVYYVDVPAESWRLGLDVIQDMTFGARIDPAELEQEKNVVLSELQRGEDNPGQLLFKTIQGMVWDGTTYQWPIIGTRESLASITRPDIKQYIRGRYQPQSMLLVVAGKVEAEQVIEEAKRVYGGLRNDRFVTPPQPFTLQAKGPGPRVRALEGEWNKVYLSAAFPIPGLRSNETVGLDVFAHMLGGDRTSLLYNRFKYEKRLVDEISAFSMTLERGGLLYISATLDADKVERFWSELVNTFADLEAAGFTDQELERAKLNLEDSLFQAKETLSGLASKIGYFQFFEGSVVEAEENYLYGLRNVNKPQIEGLLQAYFQPDKLSAAILAPSGANIDAKRLEAVVAEGWPRAETQKAKLMETLAAETEVLQVGANTVVLLPDATLPYAAFSMSWPGGDGLIRPQEAGLTELASKVLIRGTSSLSAPEVQEYLADRASSLAASAGRETFALSAKYPSRFEADMLRLIEDVLTDPAMAPDELDRARAEIVAEIKQREDQPTGLAFRRMFPFLFTGQGYGILHQGTPETLAALSREDVRDYWRTQAGQPFVLSVCGAFDRQAVLQLARNLEKELGQPKTRFSFAAPKWNEERVLPLSLPGRNQLHILRVFPIPGEGHPDSAGLELMRAALAGQSGILFRDLRDKQGLGYTVTAFTWQAPEVGLMAFYIGTEPAKQEQALKGFDRAIANLRSELLPKEELTRAQNLLRGDYYRDHQSLLSRSREAAGLKVKNLDLEYNREIIQQAQQLTPEDLRGLAEKYLDLEDSYLVVVQP